MKNKQGAHLLPFKKSSYLVQRTFQFADKEALRCEFKKKFCHSNQSTKNITNILKIS